MLNRLNREMAAYFAGLYPGESKVLVFGEGQAGALLLLIGEAPGQQEALAGRPFVGKAGKNLDLFLEKTGFDRSQLYITNTVKFRPTRISPAGRTVNRPPSREEVALFLPWLQREIRLVAPACLVTLGNTALQALLDRDATVGALHGAFQRAMDLPLFPLYHPASLIYNPRLAPQYQQDLERLAQWRIVSNVKF